ncbi:MAG: EAL domain-containing protein [Pantoea sp.]|uniref:EAL domain-containing protein n=1 Tax=Pantoea sp. TaxID=69393 RepID=UPI0039E6C733
MTAQFPAPGLLHALREQQIFAVYQPVADINMQPLGMELLARRDYYGYTQQPAEFLAGEQSLAAWEALTQFMLDEAVRQINQSVGGYFTVNIPASLAQGDGLLPLVRAVLSVLADPQRAGGLILEIDEKIDFCRFRQAVVNVAALRQAGVGVLLDDCFSVSGAPFPALSIPFSGYKLDRGIVWLARHDDKARRIIMDLAKYCHQSGRVCIAEGVETGWDLSLLTSMGVSGFQGYLISPPVAEADMRSLALLPGLKPSV